MITQYVAEHWYKDTNTAGSNLILHCTKDFTALHTWHVLSENELSPHVHAVILSFVQVGVYMPLYDVLIQQMDGMGSTKHLAAGACARTVSVMIIAPLDLVRTNTQAYFHPAQLATEGGSSSQRTWAALSMTAREMTGFGRFQLLWRGELQLSIVHFRLCDLCMSLVIICTLVMTAQSRW